VNRTLSALMLVSAVYHSPQSFSLCQKYGNYPHLN
jgi:hypothetical protein